MSIVKTPATGPDLQGLREELEAIDRQLLALLRQRMERVEAVAESKLARAFPFQDHEREEHVLTRVRQIAVDCVDSVRVLGTYPIAIEPQEATETSSAPATDEVEGAG